MIDDFESELQQRLTASANALPYKADRSQHVRTRGRRRRIVSQAATSVFAVIAILGVVGVANVITNQPDNTTQVLGEPDVGGRAPVVGQENADAADEPTGDGNATELDVADQIPDGQTGGDVLTAEDSELQESENSEGQTADTDPDAEDTAKSTPDVIPPRGECLSAPPLAAVSEAEAGKTIVNVSTEPELQRAAASPTDNVAIVLAPGTYELTKGLRVTGDNVTIRGDSTRCDEIVLAGSGMDNQDVGSGIWTNSSGLKVQNLTIRDVYNNAVQISVDAETPELYNLRLVDTGEGFIIANSSTPGQGPDNGIVDYVSMVYTDGPSRIDHGDGTGSTNGVTILGGDGWVVKNSRFENFHTPDDSDRLWNGAVQISWGASNTMVDSNVFVDVDRAVAVTADAGDSPLNFDTTIRNNMITMSADLYSSQRTANADAAIIVWGSPNTKVFHNTIITQGNTPLAIELRFDSSGTEVRNNLIDAPVSDRSDNDFVDQGNVETSDLSIFRGLSSGDLRLTGQVAGVTGEAPRLSDVAVDIDGESRSSQTDIGADELSD